MILVDTSVLIKFFKGDADHKTEIFKEILEQDVPFGISAYTYQDVLQPARRNGVTPRSTLDILIALTAIANNLVLLHHDRDFDIMAGHIEELRILG